MKISASAAAKIQGQPQSALESLVEISSAWWGRPDHASQRAHGTQPVSATWLANLELYGPVSVKANVDADDTETSTLHVSAHCTMHVPYFSLFMWPLLKSGLRKHVRSLVSAARDAAEGSDAPDARLTQETPATPATQAPGQNSWDKRPWWAPPCDVTPDEITIIATLCFITFIAAYCGALVTQAVNPIAQTFHANDAELGVALAITRVGTLLSLAGAILADKTGRRRILVWSTTALLVATAVSALSPNLTTFVVLQLVVRGLVNLIIVVSLIALTEQAPERARAYSLALASLAGGLGFGVGAVLLPVTDFDIDAWRLLFAIAALALFAMRGVGRRLPESYRFVNLKARKAKTGRVREVFDRYYRKRFLLLLVCGFFTAMLAAPSSQFTNRFLSHEQGFSATDILLLKTIVSPLALVAVVVGGRLAESKGRRVIAVWATTVAIIADAIFFTSGGLGLWIAFGITASAGSLSTPAWSALGTEMFPTEVRGSANGALLVMSVIGSVIGLLVVGALSNPLGSIGLGIAIVAIGPLLSTLILVPKLPESMGVDLDMISPPEV